MKELLDKILAKKWEDMTKVERAIVLASSIDEEAAEDALIQFSDLLSTAKASTVIVPRNKMEARKQGALMRAIQIVEVEGD